MFRPFPVGQYVKKIHAEHPVIAAVFLLTVVNAIWLLATSR